MATKRHTYPTITARGWWKLRERFRQTVPGKVDARYLATVLEIEERSAEANVLIGLRAVGLIDKDGIPTAQANEWRDDEQYPKVCKEIREAVYPRALRDAVPAPDPRAAQRWFMRDTGRGVAAGRKMASLYTLLTEADPTSGQKPARSKTRRKTPPSSKEQPATPTPPRESPERQVPDDRTPRLPDLGMPEVRLNLEIRIDASVTPEQIDQIFASMEKHLYRRGDANR